MLIEDCSVKWHGNTEYEAVSTQLLELIRKLYCFLYVCFGFTNQPDNKETANFYADFFTTSIRVRLTLFKSKILSNNVIYNALHTRLRCNTNLFAARPLHFSQKWFVKPICSDAVRCEPLDTYASLHYQVNNVRHAFFVQRHVIIMKINLLNPVSFHNMLQLIDHVFCASGTPFSTPNGAV